MVYNITLIPGDGIGPEVISAAVKCIEASGVEINWTTEIAGEIAIKKYRTPLPDETIESIKKTKVALKGPITTPVGGGFRSVNVELRKKFDLYANVRPAKLYPGVKTKFSSVDLIVIRENLEDIYIGIEFEKGKRHTKELLNFINKTNKIKLSEDTSVSLKIISKHESERIAEFAFEYAKKNNRKKVTAVHKANIMKYTDGLFLEAAKKLAKRYPKIKFEDRIVDNMAMQLVQKPELYDVILCPNLYGDIISDLCAGLTGGLGIMPAANIGDKYAIFETAHGSAPKYAGKKKANPTAAILAGAMMLKHIGENKRAEIIERAIEYVIKEGKHVTYDLSAKKPAGTTQITDAIIRHIEKSL